jgi:Tol biopolymer transport system component
MADLKVALEELKEESDSGRLTAAAPAAARHAWPLWLIVPAAVMVTLLVALLVWYSLRPEPAGILKAIPLTSYPGKEAYASFSPDGNQVAFSWNGPGEDNWDIYVKLIATEAIRRLTSEPAADLDPAWSPDGNHIAFLRTTSDNRVEVVLIPSIGGPQRVVGEIQAPGGAIYRRLTWSPNGKGFVVVHRDSPQEPFALFWLALGGEERRLTSPPAGWWGDRDPAFSPDGRTLLFSRASTNNVSELYRLALSPDMTPGRDATRLTFLNRYSISPVWTADGRDVIFASGQSYWTHLWRMRASGSGTPERLPFAGEGSWQAAVSSSGRRLAYSVSYYDFNIWRVSIGEPGRAAGPPRLLIYSTRPDRFPKYSPDGKRIAFESTRSGSSEIWVSDSDGSNSLKLTALGAAQHEAPVWSPDGRWIAFSAPLEGREDIFVVSAQGGEPRRVTNDPARAVQPQWSPDGHWIYFQSSRTGAAKIWKVPAERGEALLTQRMHLGPISADGGYVFFTKGQGASLWKAPLEGGEETRVLDSFFASSFAMVKEGIYFIFRQESGGQSRQSIKFHKFADKTTRLVLDLPKQPGSLDVSPDGSTIVYAQQDQNVWDLVLVENFR